MDHLGILTQVTVFKRFLIFGFLLIEKTFLFSALRTSSSGHKFQSTYQKVHNPNFYSIDFIILG
ncbi:MAG: hypothetical protein CMJ16_08300 [Peredibacter sp.]|nr:hypothetical protein [Peredibacter sp.]